MTIDDIERLVRRLDPSDITTFELWDGATSLTLRFATGAAEQRPGETPSAASAEAAGRFRTAQAVRARAIGVLRLRHPAAAPAAEPAFPRPVHSGEIVAFLEAGACLRPVVVDEDCTIGAPLRADGAIVGYGTPLFPVL